MSLRTLRKLKGDSDILVPELAKQLKEEEESSATVGVTDLAQRKSRKKKNKKAAAANLFDVVGEEFSFLKCRSTPK